MKRITYLVVGTTNGWILGVCGVSFHSRPGLALLGAALATIGMSAFVLRAVALDTRPPAGTGEGEVR